MSINKGKARRERKKAGKEQTQPARPEEQRPIKGWVLRLVMMIPPVLFACYLAWNHTQQ